MTEQTGKRLNQYTEDYVVFDLETTGLSPVADAIIEISGIKVRGRHVSEEFSTLVNPGRPIPRAATNVNGITDKMVQDAPALPTALEKFLEFIGEDILVGHNIHSFDMEFLQNGARRALGRKVSNDYVDTLYLARTCLPHLPRHRLTDVAAHFHIGTKGAHRALNDCVMNQQCYEKLGEMLKSQSFAKTSNPSSGPSCPNCGSPLLRRSGRFGEFWGCSTFPRCRYTRNA